MNIIVLIGFLLVISGIAGCIFPVVPGIVLSYCALILLLYINKWKPFSTVFLVIWGIIVLIITALDYIVPKLTSKKYGASKFGVWGSVIGMIIGLSFLSLIGLIIGSFVGAVIGEIIYSKNKKSAIKAGAGVFVGTIFGIILKPCIIGVTSLYFIRAIIAH